LVGGNTEQLSGSSHLITHKIKPDSFFKWPGSYGAFTVSHGDRDRVVNYIKNQVAHHQQKSLIDTWELGG
jgi:hypothetical protein